MSTALWPYARTLWQPTRLSAVTQTAATACAWCEWHQFAEDDRTPSVDRVRVRGDAQPLCAGPGRQGVQAVGAGDQAAGGGDGGRSSGAARGAELVDRVLLAQAGQPQQGQTAALGGGHHDAATGSDFYEFTGTKLQDFPLPAALPLDRARRLDALAQQLAACDPAAVVRRRPPDRRARLAEARAEHDQLRATDDRRAGGAGLGGLRPLRAARRRPDLLRRRPARRSTWASGRSRSPWPARWRRARRPRLVRPARLDADHRDPGALAGGLPRPGPAAARPDRVRPEHPPAGEAGAQAALGGRAVGEAAGGRPARLAARPAGGPAVLVRPRPPHAAQHQPAGRRGGPRRRPGRGARALGGPAGRADHLVADPAGDRRGGAVPGRVPAQGLRAAQVRGLGADLGPAAPRGRR